MESSEDKHWASKYLLDPLTAPQPSDETGPGTHHNATTTASAPSRNTTGSTQGKSGPSVDVRAVKADPTSTPNSSVRSSNNPYRKDIQNSTAYPSPPQSASPRTSQFPNFDGSYSPSNRYSTASTQIPTSTGGQNPSTVNGSNANGNAPGRRSRGSSLGQRHPGDQTHRPLDMLRHDAKLAYRAPHLKKKHFVGADSIDVLDDVGPANAYHHEGPYDAALLARNNSYNSSPLEAIKATNEEALRATPKEMIQDSLEKHRPLDGVASVPPGMPDRNGNVLDYEEGTDMMIENQPEGGAYKRWPGVKYSPEDLKGKGEPAYSIEKALKDHNSATHKRNISEPHNNHNNHNHHHLPFRSPTAGRASGAELASIEMQPTSPTNRLGHRRPLSVDASSNSRLNRGKGADNTLFETTSGLENDDDDDETSPQAASSSNGLGRSGSLGGKLRKRLGSLRSRNRGGAPIEAWKET